MILKSAKWFDSFAKLHQIQSTSTLCAGIAAVAGVIKRSSYEHGNCDSFASSNKQQRTAPSIHYPTHRVASSCRFVLVQVFLAAIISTPKKGNCRLLLCRYLALATTWNQTHEDTSSCLSANAHSIVRTFGRLRFEELRHATDPHCINRYSYVRAI